MTLRRPTPPTLRILSPPKVRAGSWPGLFAPFYPPLVGHGPLCLSEITIHLDDSDALSAASCHDGESERFVSTGSTGRRVSFNESALYEQEKMTQEKARRYRLGFFSQQSCEKQVAQAHIPFLRYTLTEGDFHHLKKARLTHLHLPPAPCDLKILTIMECDSTESSTINISEAAAPKLPLTIYQVSQHVSFISHTSPTEA